MKRVAALAFFALLAGSSPARAVGIFGTYVNAGDLGTGYGAGVSRHISVPVVPLLSVDVRGSWLHFADTPVAVDMFPLEVLGRVDFSSFYGGLGAGYYLLSAASGSADNKSGAFVLAGLEVAPAGLGFYVEGRYLFLNTDAAFGPLDANGFGASAGILLNW